MFCNWCTGYKRTFAIFNFCPFKSTPTLCKQEDRVLQTPANQRVPVLSKKIKGLKNGKKKKRERTQECQNCGYFRALKKTHSSEQTGSATCLSIIPACTSKPYLLPLSHAAHNNHTSHTRTTEGHSWTTDLYCCFTLKLTSKTSLTSGLEQLCVGDPRRATTLSFSNLVFSSLKHSKTIHCFCCVL